VIRNRDAGCGAVDLRRSHRAVRDPATLTVLRTEAESVQRAQVGPCPIKAPGNLLWA
jgi:hypothetical protein